MRFDEMGEKLRSLFTRRRKVGASLDESPPSVGLRGCELIASGSWWIAGKSDRRTLEGGGDYWRLRPPPGVEVCMS
jgi:hypothetical protein